MSVTETEEMETVGLTVEQARISEVKSRLRDAGDPEDYEETTTQIVSMLAFDADDASHSLVLMSGREIGRRYQLMEGTWSVGRDVDCDFRFDDTSLSRKHAGLQVDEGSVIVFDEGSTNGTYVGDDEIERRPLIDGDFVRFGRVQLKYLSGSNVEHTYHEELRRLTITCSMTQTFNRRHFCEMLKREFSRARRHSRPVSVLMLDLDRFKSINDIFGHLAGDNALRAAATVFRSCLREEDCLARFGGEEFAVILPDTDLEGATLVAERICESLFDFELRFKDQEIPISVSIGVSELTDDDGADGMSILARADGALYQAKNAGRNRVCNGTESE